MLKRFRPAPHGRAHRIRKHTNHVTIVVDSRVPVGPVVDDAVEVEEVETSED
jgi:large subunit ribosomal protein L22